jgi:hypothetical protein
MLLSWPTFVVERRVNQPPQVVQAALRRTDALTVESRIPLGIDGELCLETPWRPALSWHSLSWRANGRLVNRRGRVVARVATETEAVRRYVRARAM